MSANSNPALKRELGLFDAMMMGLGSILGTGIFVSIGLAAGLAGPAVILAIGLAAVVATCNALSSAQLAAAYPVSGGTYEYGYRCLNSWAGFLAGWMFLLAKSASAATAALGFAGYSLAAMGWDSGAKSGVAFVTVAIFTVIVITGIRRSSQLNIVIVSTTVASLAVFIGAAMWHRWSAGAGAGAFMPFFRGEDWGDATGNLLHASALMFVAYTGYGRIATLAEEVKNPRRVIPRAIIATLGVSALLYVGVSAAGVGAVGAEFLASATETQAAPLEVAAREFNLPAIVWVVAVGAAMAMLGVLLNLILGLSRVLLAMGRRGDMPGPVARLDKAGRTPWAAVLVIGVVVGGLALTGSVKTTWSFSAFTVLIYYAITNLSALMLRREQRLFPAWIPAAGLGACLFLAFWVDVRIWVAGLALAGAGLLWHAAARKLKGRGGTGVTR